MFSQQVFQDFKENVKSSMPTKTSTLNSRKGLRSCNINSFSDIPNVSKNKKNISKNNPCAKKLFIEEKENSRLKVETQEKRASHDAEDSWSDIEEMHISVEPDDDYEDILPQCDRIQKRDIDSLFLTYTSTKYAELTVERLPSPLKELENLDIPDLSLQFPHIKASLFDDSEISFIALPNDLSEVSFF